MYSKTKNASIKLKKNVVIDSLDAKHLTVDTFENKYKLGEELGRGAYSSVRLCTDKVTNKNYAVKIVKLNELDADELFQLQEEIDIMKKLHHPNVIEFVNWYHEENVCYIVLELMKGGELFERIVEKKFFSEKEARDVMKVVFEAIKYCHDQNVVHRDLKPENLLLTTSDENAVVKIADFGFAKVMNARRNNLKTECGTTDYMAPEVLDAEEKHNTYGSSCDMWSLGVIMYILLCGYAPFDHENRFIRLQQIRRAEFSFHHKYWGHVSNEAKDLISTLLRRNPSERCTAEQALQHPWFQVHDHRICDRGISLDDSMIQAQLYLKINARRRLKGAMAAVVFVNHFLRRK